MIKSQIVGLLILAVIIVPIIIYLVKEEMFWKILGLLIATSIVSILLCLGWDLLTKQIRF